MAETQAGARLGLELHNTMQRAIQTLPTPCRRSGVAALLLALTWAGGWSDAMSPAPGDQNAVAVPTAAGREFYLTDDLNQRKCSAVRILGACRHTGRILTEEAPHTLTNRLIVAVADTAPLEKLVRPMNATAEPLADVPGYWLVSAQTVADALVLAERLAGRAAEEAAAPGLSVMLDIEGHLQPRAPTDPAYPQQWHLRNMEIPAVDLNVEPVWAAGFTGQGVVIGIVDLGFRIFHPDLALNYFAMGSQTASPIAFQHGTRCAGVAAAVGYNGLGGVGVAYQARLSQQIYGSSSQTAAALAFRNDLNHIKSNSYGPADTGRIAYLSAVERSALQTAVTSGRGGRGTIFTWAAGNGARLGDRMDYDPYASNRFVISVGALTDEDRAPDYSEPGAALVGVTPSSGGTRGVFTTDYDAATGDSYTTGFGMTSATAPQAAGLAALLLEANPLLGWRDVQHILIRTARRCDPEHPGWVWNGAGRWVNEQYGFGALDAAAAVALAQTWRNVRPALATQVVETVAAPIPDGDPAGLTRVLTATDDLRIEAVELQLNVQTSFVGDLEVLLESPAGSTSLLAAVRNDPTDNYVNYVFTSRRHWDEHSAGAWRIRLIDRVSGAAAFWSDVRLTIHGVHRPGDLNCDRRVDLADIDGFVTALLGSGFYGALQPECDFWLADLNEDGAVDFRDIDGFVAVLLG